MATMTSSSVSQASTSTSSTRERMALAPWLEAVKDDDGRVLGFALRLSSLRFLEGDETHKASYSGLMEAGFVDPVSGESPSFVDANGVTRAGKCPVRLLGTDGLSAYAAFGIQQDRHLLLGVKSEAGVSVYRNESGSVAFLVLRAGDLTAARRWVTPPLVDIKARDFSEPEE